MNDPPRRQAPTLAAILGAAAATTAVVSACAYLLPREHAATGVGLSFLLATYVLVLRGDQNDEANRVAHHGLSLGGLLEAEPLDARRIARATLQALGWALLLAALIFPAFWLGYRYWHAPHGDFTAPSLLAVSDELLGELMVIALPEEAFYRGYLLTALDDRFPPKRRVLGAEVGWGLFASSAVFALGHLATDLDPNRLAVFFPALVFGWLRARTGGIGAGTFFHAFCNLFALYLAKGYGFSP